MRPPNPNRDKVLAAIREQIETNGQETVHDAWQRFPDIPRGTWYRYVNRVLEELGLRAPKHNPSAVAKKHASGRSKAKPQTKPPATRHRAAPPSKRQKALTLDQTVELTMQQRWELLYRQAEDLMRSALRDDGSIKNPVVFAQSIKTRRELMNTAISVLQEIWNVEKLQRFYDAILVELREADAELAHRVVNRLERLEAELSERSL